MNEEDLPKLLATQAQAVVERAKSLGLTWTLRPATVLSPDLITYDGDEIPVGAVFLNGLGIATDRVMCIQVPPGGNFVIGRLPGSPVPETYVTPTFRGKEASTGDVTLTVATQATTATLTLTLDSPGEYMIIAVTDFDQTVSAGNNLGIGVLQVDGASATQQMLFGVTAAGQRATVTQTYTGSLTAGAHTFRLIANKVNNIGTFIARGTHTGFMYQVWQ